VLLQCGAEEQSIGATSPEQACEKDELFDAGFEGEVLVEADGRRHWPHCARRI
jgi:hypothetical protein